MLTLGTLLDTLPPHLPPLTMSQRAKLSKHQQASDGPATNANAAKSHDEGQDHAESTNELANEPSGNGLRKSARLIEEKKANTKASTAAQQAEIAKTSNTLSDTDEEPSQGNEKFLTSSRFSISFFLTVSSQHTNLTVRFI